MLWQSGWFLLSYGLGLMYANGAEWLTHRFVLHGLGKKKRSIWSFHWREHHRNARRHGHLDPDYERSVFGWHAQGKEALGVVAMTASHLWLAPFAPGFVVALVYSSANYLVKHRRAHRDPSWAREHLTWHYDHHMGKDQDANWCVTKPWFDLFLGTRKAHAFTPAEQQPIHGLAVDPSNDQDTHDPSAGPRCTNRSGGNGSGGVAA